MVALEPGGGVDQQSEAGGVALGEAVFAEALDLAEAALGEGTVIALHRHPVDETVAEAADGAGLAESGERAAEAIRLLRAEPGGDDGDPHRLLLKERHAEGAAEYLTQLIGGELDRLLAPAAADIGVHHVALDRPRTDDRHLDHQVVEVARPHPWQEIHLRPALDLEDAERIGPAEHVVGGRIGLGQGCQGVAGAGMGGDQVEGLADAGQHAEGEDVDFQDPQRVDVVLVPFDHRAGPPSPRSRSAPARRAARR